MCLLALTGARTEIHRLREAVTFGDDPFDTDLTPSTRLLACFPAADAVVCVTLRGCSCALLDGATAREAGSPSHRFRRALAEAARRFGGVRLLTCKGHPQASVPRALPAVASAGQLFRSEQLGEQRLLCITP